MLTARDARRDTGRRRAVPSQKQRYNEYVLQRIEAFKNSLSREELLILADQAHANLDDKENDQFVLTEMLMEDAVDSHIRKQLSIRGFDHWRARFAKLRPAQREPTHWGLDRSCPVVPLLGRVEPGDKALVIGSGAEAAAYILAAHDTDLRFWDTEIGVVERVEQKMLVEFLAMRFLARWVNLECEVPSHGAPYDIVVLDCGVLAAMDARRHADVLAQLQDLTAEAGVHVLLHSPKLVPEAAYSFYSGWVHEQLPGRRTAPKSRGAVLVKPAANEERQAEQA
jgi:hypothetical protein